MPALVAGLLVALLCALSPQPVEAHAAAIGYTPEPGAQLDRSPARIEIAFNEALETGIGTLEVLDSDSRPVTREAVAFSEDRRTIALALPSLPEGVYTVAYRVVSADGHPVASSYVFVVGDPPERVEASDFDLHRQLGHEGHGAATALSAGDFFHYAVRAVYYILLTASVGLMLWQALTPSGSGSALLERTAWTAVQILPLGVLLHVFVQVDELLRGEPLADWAKLFTQTTIGLQWTVLLAFAFAGFALGKADGPLRAVWALALLAAEGFSGHAAAYRPAWYALTLDIAHLIASAVWAGGLVYLLVLWRAERPEAGRFAARFMGTAWLALLLLALTGVLQTLLFLPGLDYLLITPWGALLLIKTGLVLLAAAAGALLRRGVRRRRLPSGLLLKGDATLMLLILIVVGVFTYVSPLPANEPISRHQMGQTLHTTLQVSPGSPGDNTFVVKVWLPEDSGGASAVELLLYSDRRGELGPIEVPLERFEGDEAESFIGFAREDYRAAGPYLPFPGQWRAELVVYGADGTKQMRSETFRLY
ncbi:copper resistance protein CopC/CopD [Paenibacillus sp. IB182496]|uniref:Copper resistance protein CopC/CopD n=2 Tax=Paenibacillus sabuli TaxID=2772509 RepID=A0A927BZX5_9BACL|nr:copper resistance protein CopC/CopD [Paenibacillus sabuli]